MFFGRETQTVKNSLHFALGIFNSLANGHFTLPGEQGHLAHLAQIHSQGIVQRLKLGLLIGLLRLRLLSAVHLRLVDDLNVQIAERAINLRQTFGRDQRLGQRLVNVVERQIALLARQSNQFLALPGEVDAGLTLDRAE